MMSSAKLINQLKDGDEKAYEKLVKTYGDSLFGYSLSLSGDHHSASDIVQEVFIKTYEYKKKLNHNYSIEGFLRRSVYNKFIDNYYKNKSRSKLHENYLRILNQLVSIPDEESSIRLEKLRKEIENLPKKIKEIFVLSKTNGYTNVEISSHLGISVKTVESNITKAYKILRSKLN